MMPLERFNMGEKTRRITLRVDKRNDSSCCACAMNAGLNHLFKVSANASLSFRTAHFVFPESVVGPAETKTFFCMGKGKAMMSPSPCLSLFTISAVSLHRSTRKDTPKLCANFSQSRY